MSASAYNYTVAVVHEQLEQHVPFVTHSLKIPAEIVNLVVA
jgi:hypothetical protein